jgi:membrane protein
VSAAWAEVEGLLFDVEGTLVDSVALTLRCWQETLRENGLQTELDTLQMLSGMDGNAMLAKLFPSLDAERRKELTAQQGERYREHYLPKVRSFPDVSNAFAALKSKGYGLGLATDCQPDELDHYLELTGVRSLVDAVACGADVPNGKPAPDLVVLGMQRLKVGAAAMIGDTPFDAIAAHGGGAAAIGVKTGGFGEGALRKAGCAEVLSSVAAIPAVIPRRM